MPGWRTAPPGRASAPELLTQVGVGCRGSKGTAPSPGLIHQGSNDDGQTKLTSSRRAKCNSFHVKDVSGFSPTIMDPVADGGQRNGESPRRARASVSRLYRGVSGDLTGLARRSCLNLEVPQAEGA